MFYPQLTGVRGTREELNTFYGYNHKLKIRDGELYDSKNLTTQRFPLLSSRERRGVTTGFADQQGGVTPFTHLQAIIAKDALFFVENGTLYKNGLPTALTGLQTAHETQLVSMGAYICIFPDKKYFNTAAAGDYGSMEASKTYTGSAVYRMCHSDGSVYANVTKGSAAPDNPANGDVWIDTSSGSAKEYSLYTRMWAVIETVYTRIDFSTEGQFPTLFREYDGVTVSGAHFPDLNGSKILYAVGQDATTHKDFVVLVGIQEEPYTDESASISVSRTVPAMDFVCECQNRLWGCRYGNDGGQNVNEIFCCALGDFRNWSQYLNTSSDSWRASCGSDGQWTGCINYLGTPTFFKESMIHQVAVSLTGAHRIQDFPARGVQKGSHRSLAVVNETLYYKSRNGITAFQGGLPAGVSDALGETLYYEASAGAFGERYYISMRDGADVWHFFCYDAARGLWMHEDNLHAVGFAQVDDELYCIADNKIVAINGTAGTAEDSLLWRAESGMLQYSRLGGGGAQPVRYVSRFDFRLQLAQSAEITMSVEYDSSGVWETVGTITGSGKIGSVVVPVRPRRCDHLRIRLDGSGDMRLLSVSRILTKGSDV